MAVAGVDVLRGEAIAFAEALLKAGVKVRVKEYEKMPHLLLQLDKLLELPVIDKVMEVVRDLRWSKIGKVLLQLVRVPTMRQDGNRI